MKRLVSVLILSLMMAGASRLWGGEMHRAAAAGDLAKVQALVKADADLVNARDLGTTPLHEAARHGHVEVVKFLLAHGADASVKDVSGLTPLRLALGYRRLEVAELLKQHAATVSAPSSAPAQRPAKPVVQRPPLRKPAEIRPPVPAPSIATEPVTPLSPILPNEFHSPTVVTSKPPELTPVTVPIHDAAELGDVEMVTMLLRKWPELREAENEKGLRPLHVAAANAKIDVVRLLLNQRANVEATTRYGWVPLHFAATRGDPATTALLLKAGAQVDTRSRTDETPLHMAVRAGHAEVVQLLLQHKADANARDKTAGSTPLHLAVTRGSQPLVELLIAKGAEVNALDEHGDTPLTLALAGGRDAIAALLQRHGGREPQGKPLSTLEQSLVDYYRQLDHTFRSGSASDKRKAALSMAPSRSDVDKIFPKHKAQARDVVEQLERDIKAALEQGFTNTASEPPIWKLQPAPPGISTQRCQAQGWIASDVPIFTLVVKKRGGRTVADEYCFVNGHWVPLPPLDRIFGEGVGPH